MFLNFINDIVNHVRAHGKYGIEMIPGMDEMFALFFADDVAILSAIFEMLLNCDSPKERNWACFMKKTLSKLALPMNRSTET